MPLQILPALRGIEALIGKGNFVDSLTGGGLGAPGTPAGSSPSIMGGRDYDALQGLLPDVGGVAPNVPGNISGMPPVQGISPDGQTGGPLDRITGGLRKVNELIENLPILSQFLGTPTQEVRRDLLRAQTAGTAPWEAQQEHARGMAGAGMSFDVIQEMNKMAQAERDRQFQAQLKEIELRKRGEIAESRDRTAMDVAQLGAGQRREAATGRELQGLMEGYDMASPEMRKLVRDRLRPLPTRRGRVWQRRLHGRGDLLELRVRLRLELHLLREVPDGCRLSQDHDHQACVLGSRWAARPELYRRLRRIR